MPESLFPIFLLLMLNVIMTTFCAYALGKAVLQRDPCDTTAETIVLWSGRALKPILFFVGATSVIWGAALVVEWLALLTA